MANHDYVIANGTGSAVRADLNLALQAVLTTNSGNSAPSTVAAGQLWWDSDGNTLYIRNTANDAWIPIAGATVNVIGTSTSDFFVVQTNEDGASTAPDVTLYRNSASPADNDYLGKIEYRGRNDNSQDVQYAYIGSQAIDVSDGTEDGRLLINAKINGADHTHIQLDPNGATFGGDVGVGVTPSQALSIGSSSSATPTYSMAADGEGLHLQYNDDSGARAADIVAIGNTPAGATMKMRFYANTGSGDGNAAAIMTLLGTGNVGINVAPSDPLHLYKSAADSTLRFQWDATHAGKISFREGTTETGRIEMHSPTDSVQAGSMLISTTSSGAAAKAIVFETNSAEAARILSTGNLLIGATAAGATGSKLELHTAVNVANVLYMLKASQVEMTMGFKASTDTNFYIGTGSSTVGNSGQGVYLANTGTSWTSNSDERKKKNLQPIENALDKIKDCRAMTGHFNTESDDAKKRPFLIAQDWVDALPEAVDQNTVDDDGNENLGLSYEGTIPLLVAAIKELRTQNLALTERIAILEGE